MKQKLILCILVIISMCISVSCGTIDNSETDSAVASSTIESFPEPLVTEDIYSTTEDSFLDKDPFIGEYNDVDWDEPNLDIQKGKNGIYHIEIGIYRLYQFDCCGGVYNNGKIEFITKFGDHKDLLEGTISLDGNCAIVTFFGDDWSDFSDTNTYQYFKSSDIPYDHMNE
ncbi:hypothetical protein [Anaeromicropila populeti]|uniref:Lipoprotein n=1 Tax=Anaeromicropila populeti TaxID=37658 RepID=A0A1I6LL12_9FIRM|nr:hypothetical protein [Anaeromicropila populeti]SFS04093.1 hypothetical protein SAMN05661086_03373 [Anaeromicropila populeti]